MLVYIFKHHVQRIVHVYILCKKTKQRKWMWTIANITSHSNDYIHIVRSCNSVTWYRSDTLIRIWVKNRVLLTCTTYSIYIGHDEKIFMIFRQKYLEIIIITACTWSYIFSILKWMLLEWISEPHIPKFADLF